MIRFLALLNVFLVGLRDELQDYADDLAEQLDDDNAAVALLTDVADELLALEAFSPAFEAASDVLLRLVGLRVARVVNSVWTDAKDETARKARRRGLTGPVLQQVEARRLQQRRDRIAALREQFAASSYEDPPFVEAHAPDVLMRAQPLTARAVAAQVGRLSARPWHNRPSTPVESANESAGLSET